MNETLKAAGHIGAELGAALAENARLRKALQAIDRRNDSPARFDSEIDAIVRAALSQQTEPECLDCRAYQENEQNPNVVCGRTTRRHGCEGGVICAGSNGSGGGSLLLTAIAITTSASPTIRASGSDSASACSS